MAITWKVCCCDRCFRMFDVEAGRRRTVCDECLEERRRNYNESRRHPRAPRKLSLEVRREHARLRKQRWRAQSGRH